MNYRKFGLGVALFSLIFLVGGFFVIEGIVSYFFSPTETSAELGLSSEDVDYEVVSEDLDVPWEVLILDDGEFLVTERTGDVVYSKDGEEQVLKSFDDVYGGFMGEGGLLGMTLDPNFEENNYVYFYLTEDDEEVENKVVRMYFDSEEGALENSETIIEDIPSDRIHNGGRIDFGPDDKLYITTGDAAEPGLSQEQDSLAGKILRINSDGSVPESNPFESEVYSYGHRNPQGITWDEEDRLWSTEHGDIGNDELNLIEAGHNYGWPEIEGNESHPEMEEPIIHSGLDETWAPAGAAYHNQSVFFVGLRGESLYQAILNDNEVEKLVRHFREDFGRLRAITLDSNDQIYLSTSNSDGRGDLRDNDDRIIRLNASSFDN